LLNGFSKAYAMTGWRIGYAMGYAMGPRDLIGAMMKIHRYMMLYAPVTTQMAALKALKCSSEVKIWLPLITDGGD